MGPLGSGLSPRQLESMRSRVTNSGFTQHRRVAFILRELAALLLDVSSRLMQHVPIQGDEGVCKISPFLQRI